MSRPEHAGLLVVLATLMLLGAACAAGGTSPPAPTSVHFSSPTPVGGPASTPIPTLAGPTPTVISLGEQPIQSFRFTMIISDTTATGVEVTRLAGEWTTEALHLITTITAADGEHRTESYIIGDTAYIQESGGRWTKGPGGDPAARLLMNPTWVLQQAQEQGTLTLTPLGVGLVEGISCARYQVQIQGLADAGPLFAQGIAWVGLNDGRVYRFEFERTEEGLRSLGVMTCFDYNTAIIIQPPIW